MSATGHCAQSAILNEDGHAGISRMRPDEAKYI